MLVIHMLVTAIERYSNA